MYSTTLFQGPEAPIENLHEYLRTKPKSINSVVSGKQSKFESAEEKTVSNASRISKQFDNLLKESKSIHVVQHSPVTSRAKFRSKPVQGQMNPFIFSLGPEPDSYEFCAECNALRQTSRQWKEKNVFRHHFFVIRFFGPS